MGACVVLTLAFFVVGFTFRLLEVFLSFSSLCECDVIRKKQVEIISHKLHRIEIRAFHSRLREKWGK